MSNDQVFAVIDCLFRQNRMPYSADAVYVFLAASNVNNAGAEQPGVSKRWPDAFSA